MLAGRATGDVAGCGPLAFTPSLGLSSTNTQAGADTALTVNIERPDRQARLLRSTVSLPPGLAGRLLSVPACPVDQARAAACGEDSRVGSATVAVGNGAEPLALGARVYLTEAFGGGVAGLAIVVPAKVGPIDLGTVVTLAKLKLRPDAGIEIETEELPQVGGGIPTPYRTIALIIDRPGFTLNPTSCAALPAHGAFTATGGEQAAADTPTRVRTRARQPDVEAEALHRPHHEPARAPDDPDPAGRESAGGSDLRLVAVRPRGHGGDASPAGVTQPRTSAVRAFVGVAALVMGPTPR